MLVIELDAPEAVRATFQQKYPEKTIQTGMIQMGL
jgi:hypothetical protein